MKRSVGAGDTKNEDKDTKGSIGRIVAKWRNRTEAAAAARRVALLLPDKKPRTKRSFRDRANLLLRHLSLL